MIPLFVVTLAVRCACALLGAVALGLLVDVVRAALREPL